MKLWVNGALVINNWNDHGETVDTTAAIQLEAGRRYNIKLEYYDGGGNARIGFNWLTPNATTYVPVPASALYAN